MRIKSKYDFVKRVQYVTDDNIHSFLTPSMLGLRCGQDAKKQIGFFAYNNMPFN